MAKNEKAANEFRESLGKDEVKKVYYARIIGNFEEKVGYKKATVDKCVFMKNYKKMLHDCE
jgi:23S rRNA-/tRNA-specific pseudouridylate synthase